MAALRAAALPFALTLREPMGRFQVIFFARPII
jgi:hypothetical protein